MVTAASLRSATYNPKDFANANILLDTNALIYQLNGKIDLTDGLVKAGGLFISAITEAELFAGTQTSDLADLQEYLEEFTVIPVTSEIAKLAGAYKSIFTSRGLKDLIISATAQVHGFTIVTANKKDFSDIDKVKKIFIPVLI